MTKTKFTTPRPHGLHENLGLHKVQGLLDSSKVETPIHDNIRELVTWDCKEHGVTS